MLVVCIIVGGCLVLRNIDAISACLTKGDWHDYYDAHGHAASWAIGPGPYVCFDRMPDWMWDRDVSASVGLVRLALSLKAAIELAVPNLESELYDEGPIVCAASLLFHLHRLVGAPIAMTACVRMALMVYHDEDYMKDPVTVVQVLARRVEWNRTKPTPLLDALGTQLARPLVAPLALRQRR